MVIQEQFPKRTSLMLPSYIMGCPPLADLVARNLQQIARNAKLDSITAEDGWRASPLRCFCERLQRLLE